MGFALNRLWTRRELFKPRSGNFSKGELLAGRQAVAAYHAGQADKPAKNRRRNRQWAQGRRERLELKRQVAAAPVAGGELVRPEFV